MGATANAATDQREAVSARTYPIIWLVVAAVVLAAVLGFAFGARRSGVAPMTGTANVGDHIASIKSGDTYYGVRESVAWFDESGSFHEDGWPECLDTADGQVDVRFGVVPVSPADSGLTFYDVAYVDCRSA